MGHVNYPIGKIPIRVLQAISIEESLMEHTSMYSSITYIPSCSISEKEIKSSVVFADTELYFPICLPVEMLEPYPHRIVILCIPDTATNNLN